MRRKSCFLILPSTKQIGPYCFRVSWTIIIIIIIIIYISSTKIIKYSKAPYKIFYENIKMI